MREEYRIPRRSLAQRFVDREALHVGRWRRIPILLVPAAPYDPFARLRFLRRIGDLGHDHVPGSGIAAIQVNLGLTNPAEVPVPLNESRDGELPAQVNDFGGCSLIFLNFLVGAQRDNRAAGDGDGLGFRLRRFDGDDLAVTQDQVGRLLCPSKNPRKINQQSVPSECGFHSRRALKWPQPQVSEAHVRNRRVLESAVILQHQRLRTAAALGVVDRHVILHQHAI